MLFPPRVIATLATLALLLLAPFARAHEFKLDSVINAFVRIDGAEAHLVIRTPVYLFKSVRLPVQGTEYDVANAAVALERAVALLQQDVVLLEDGRPLAARSASARLALPSDRSFENVDTAVRHVAQPPATDLRIVIDQGYVDAHLIYPITSATAVFALRTQIAPELGNTLKIAVRYLAPGGAARSMLLRGGVGSIELNPTWFGAARSFVAFGVAHIATGLDHLLFLLCVVLPLRGLRPLLAVITGFTLAHSFTLIGSAFGLAPEGAWFAPFVEFAIALSIVYTALENLVGVTVRRRMLLTLLFGLVHGFGFSYGLKEELQFAGSHLLLSLLAFNVGIELGQLLALALLLPALAFVTRHVLPGRVGQVILAALLAHVGWHWMTDRYDALARESWPVPDLASLPTLLYWAGGIAIAGSLGALAVTRLRLETQRPATTAPAAE